MKKRVCKAERDSRWRGPGKAFWRTGLLTRVSRPKDVPALFRQTTCPPMLKQRFGSAPWFPSTWVVEPATSLRKGTVSSRSAIPIPSELIMTSWFQWGLFQESLIRGCRHRGDYNFSATAPRWNEEGAAAFPEELIIGWSNCLFVDEAVLGPFPGSERKWPECWEARVKGMG